MNHTSLEEFCNYGYMNVFVQGAQHIAQSISGRKATLIFTSRLLLRYNQQNTLQVVWTNLFRSTIAAICSMINCYPPAEIFSVASATVRTENLFSFLSAMLSQASKIYLYLATSAIYG